MSDYFDKKREATGLEVAVIGMAGRFPGASNLDEFWENLAAGKESITFFSIEALAQAGVSDDDLAHPGFVRANGVLAGGDEFDAGFFGYSPREVEVLDPGVRVFHEVAWHALEDAGIDPGTYPGLIGVYAGASANFEWLAYTAFSGAGSHLDPFIANQLKDKDFLCVQISYRLNLRGPSVAISTACSTSLTAIIMACQALLSGECDMALAGGTCVRLPMERGYLYREGMIASPDGHCRAFDARAAGTITGNGAGVVVLELLEQALANRESIYGVVIGSAINNDGLRKAGFTAPSIKGQAEVIRAALTMADIPVESITYIETHGTGTTLGDPVEIEALELAFNTKKNQYCAIGSVKTNIGHLDSAAGVAGFIKTVLCLHHRALPPSLHFEKPNPMIDFSHSPFYVNTSFKEWQAHPYPLRAGVSSFGIGGTNTHVILEQAPEESLDFSGLKDEDGELVLLSAKTERALNEARQKLVTFFQENPGIALGNVAFTLQVGRQRFPYRLMAICKNRDDAIEVLSRGPGWRCRSFYSREDQRPVVFMFPGQGSQYVNMARGLYETEPVFREALDRCFNFVASQGGFNLANELLYPGVMEKEPMEQEQVPETMIAQTAIAQPLLFSIEYALAQLIISWGIKPDAMIGHSIGEYVAAHLAGVFSFDDALRLVLRRGQFMQDIPTGEMMAVPIGEVELSQLLPGGIELAAVNSSSMCTVAGKVTDIAFFKEQLKQMGIEAQQLHTSHAFHSSMMDPIIKKFEAMVRPVRLQEPQVPIISNLTGQWMSAREAIDPGYWSKHIRQTVRFGDGLKLLLEKEWAIFLEVGPGRTLSTFVNKHRDKTSQHEVLNLLRHPGEEFGDREYLLVNLGRLWLYGVHLDWLSVFQREHNRKIKLPLYSFDKTRYPMIESWIPNPRRKEPGVLPPDHQTNISDWFYQLSWKQVELRQIIDTAKNRVLIVFHREPGPGPGWCQLLAKQGVEVIEVRSGDDFSIQSQQHYQLNPGKREHYEQLFLELKKNGLVPQGLLHTWTISEGELDIEQTLELGFHSLVFLAAALGKICPENHVTLAVVTNGMQDVWDEGVRFPGKSTVLGPVLTIPQEYPDISCTCIDIGPIIPGTGTPGEERVVRNLVNELSLPAPGGVVAYRGERRWVQTEERFALDCEVKTCPRRLKPGGVYLITGGLGGIGLTLAHYLAKQVKSRLVLTGHSFFPPREQWQQWLDTHEHEDEISGKIGFLLEIEKLGSEVAVYTARVEDLQEMTGVVLQAEARFGPINGVIHAAGKGGGLRIQYRTVESSGPVFAAKIRGTRVLEHIFKNHYLDFMVYCSSLAALTAPVGQVDYTAANRFLDAFARYEAANNRWRGLVVSINWDTWKKIGMAITTIKQAGFDPGLIEIKGIEPNQGAEVFGRILDQDLPQVIVCTRSQIYFSPGGSSKKDAKITHDDSTSYLRPGLDTPYAAAISPLEKIIVGLVEELTGIEQIGVLDNFFELGLSSVDIIGLTNLLKYVHLLPASPAIIFKNPCVRSLALYFEKIATGPADKRDETGKNHAGSMEM